MDRRLLLLAIATLLLVQSNSLAQSQDLRKFEIAGEFSTLARDDFQDTRMDAGGGARFTFNFNRSLAFETAGYFFPSKCFGCRNGGNVTEVLAGAKFGKRFEKWGIFAKARPGVISFSRGEFDPIIFSPTGPVDFRPSRSTAFAADIGGVLEFYPSERIVTRFDAGDTIVRFGRRNLNGIGFNPTTNEFTLFPFVRPARTEHNFQFMASVGWRF
ncbi:MAG TPA: hypothetical protein VFM63_01175 [Pyrinomonadaceae bacterium]|nr:hypothetical protein [Pyrinomonadaceae bacterium]